MVNLRPFGLHALGVLRPDPSIKPLVFEHIVPQIPHALLGFSSTVYRTGDVRVALRTADLGGAVHEISNIGLPVNSPSKIPFDGRSCMMLMLKGGLRSREFMCASEVVSAVRKAGLEEGITPEFIRDYITDKGADHPVIDQNYGPSDFSRISRSFISGDHYVHPQTGEGVSVSPALTGSGFIAGFRSPSKEMAMLVVCSGSTDELFIKGGDSAASALQYIADAAPILMGGQGTASESLMPFNRVDRAIVMAYDAYTEQWKPVDLHVAAEIYPLQLLNRVIIDPKGNFLGAFMNYNRGAPGTVVPYAGGWGDPEM